VVQGAATPNAVFDGFFPTYERRIQDPDLDRDRRSGELPRKHLHPDLVSRVAGQAYLTIFERYGMLRLCIFGSAT
jgi:hypothetical protein